MRTAEGVSLVEAVMVLLCAALLTAAALPNVATLQQRWRLWGGARLVETSLQWGRMYAVTANAAVCFQVDGSGREFHWVDPTSGERYESTVRFLPGRIRIISSPRTPLRFYQRGNAAPAGTYVLEGPAGLCRVVVNTVGRIRIQWD